MRENFCTEIVTKLKNSNWDKLNFENTQELKLQQNYSNTQIMTKRKNIKCDTT